MRGRELAASDTSCAAEAEDAAAADNTGDADGTSFASDRESGDPADWLDCLGFLALRLSRMAFRNASSSLACNGESKHNSNLSSSYEETKRIFK